MPPEQWLDRSNVSEAVDIYNLGCTYFMLLTGEYPFSGSAVMEIMNRHLNDDPLASRAARAIPKPIRTLLATMLAKEPHGRSSSEVLIEQLESILALPELDPQQRQFSSSAGRWMRRLFSSSDTKD